MFINEAFAQTGGIATGSTTNLLFQLGLIVVIFYVLIIRPQQKQIKAHKEIVKNLKKGDKVITAGGIYAKVVDASSPVDLVVEIANGVEITVARFTVKEIVPQAGTVKPAQIKNAKVDAKKPANSNKKK